MSEKLDKNSTNKINLLTLKEAATLASYSTAYLARLIKQNKIEGKQVDRQWYIDSNSLNIFLEDVAKAKKIQREKIRQERIAERNVIPLVVSDEVVRDELPKSEDISPFNLPALVGSVATVATFAFFFILGSGVHSYDYLAILDVSESLGDMSFLPEEDSTLKALAISSDGQTLLTSIKEHLWCGIEVVFLNDGRCLYLPVFEYAIAEPRKKTDQVTTTATSTVAAVENVNSGSGTTIINEYITNNPVVEVKETVIENRLVERFSTKENVTRQADELINSINELSISFETDLLTVNGELNAASTTIGGTLEASGFIASNRFVRAPYFVATDATATSTFAGALAVGTTTSNATLTVDGATYLASITAPASTSSLLYNLGGELYWAGSAIAGPSVGTWGTDGINVWRGSGNVGIGTTTPSQSLSVVGSGLITGGFGIGVATNTPGVLQTSGDALIGGNLTVMGNSTVFGNSTTIGTTTGGTLVINSRIASNLIPQINGTYNLGSPSLYWNDAYVDTLTVNNISAASTSIAGTQSETFTFNSDNASSDNEDINLIFYRGSVVPNALITWDSTADRFDINQPFFIQNDSSSTTIPTLQLAGSASQTSDIFKVNSFAGSSLFNITSAGRVGIGTSTPDSKLDIWGNLQVGTSSASTLIVNTATGQVGINTSSPTSGYSLDVAGLAYASGGFYSNNFSSSWDGSASNPNFRRASDTNTGIFFPGADNIAITTGGTERFRIDSSGNVGIGTTTPGRKLELYQTGSSNALMRLTSVPNSPGTSNESAMEFYTVATNNTTPLLSGRITSNFTGTSYTNTVLKFQNATTGGTLIDTMTLANGNVGIGVSFPEYKLNIHDVANGSDSKQLMLRNASVSTNTQTSMYFTNTNSTGNLDSGINGVTKLTSIRASDGSNNFSIFNSPGSAGSILNNFTIIGATGNVGIGTTSPSTKLSVAGNTYIAGDLVATGSITFGNFNMNAVATCGQQYHTFIGAIGDVGGDQCAALNVTQQDVNGNVIYRFGGIGQTWAGEFYANSSLVGMNTKGGIPLSFQIDQSEKMRILSNGNVGIGTTSPQSKLVVVQSNQTSTGGITIRKSNADVAWGQYINTDSSFNLAYGSESSLASTYLTVQTGTGNVGIGTTTPQDKLTVYGKIGSYSSNGTLHGSLGSAGSNLAGRLILSRRSDGAQAIHMTGATIDGTGDAASLLYSGGVQSALELGSGYISFRTATSTVERMRIDLNGNVGIGITNPQNIFQIQKDSTYSSESSAGLSVRSATADTELLLGADAVNDIGYIQAMQDGTSWTARALVLQPNGGKVGIGTTTPTTNLSVSGSTGIQTDFDGVVVEIIGRGDLGYGIVGTDTNHPLHLRTNNATRMVLDTSGNVGIGTTSPAAKFDIRPVAYSNNQANGILLGNTENNLWNSSIYIRSNESGSARLSISGPGVTDSLVINSSGNVGIGTTTPTEKLHILGGESNGSTATLRISSGLTSMLLDNNEIDTISSSLFLNSNVNGNVILATGGGNVGIGTTTPGALLDIYGNNPRPRITNTNSVLDGSLRFYENATPVAGLQAQGSAFSTADRQNDLEFFTFNGGDVSIWPNSTRAVTIKTGGNVGIGTSTPESALDVAGNYSSGQIRLGTLNQSGRIMFRRGTDGVTQSYIGYTGATEAQNFAIQASGGGSFLTLGTAGAERVRIDTDGNVGIGTINPGTMLHVTGSIQSGSPDSVAGTLIANGTSTGNAAGGSLWLRTAADFDTVIDRFQIVANANNFIFGTEDQQDLFAYNGTNNSWYFNHNGNVGIGTTTPTEKLSILSADNSVSTNIFAIRANNQGRGIGFGYNNIRLIGSTANQPLSIDAAGTGNLLLQTSATGNVGIGTTSPAAKLEIAGNTLLGTGFHTTDAGIAAIIGKNNGGSDAVLGFNSFSYDWSIGIDNSENSFAIANIVSNNPLGTNTLFTIKDSGNVGIGTTTPQASLHVPGTTVLGNENSGSDTPLRLLGSVSGYYLLKLERTSGTTAKFGISLTSGAYTWTDLVNSKDTFSNYYSSSYAPYNQPATIVIAGGAPSNSTVVRPMGIFKSPDAPSGLPNMIGSDLAIEAGASKGTATPTNIYFSTADTGSVSGTTPQAQKIRMTIAGGTGNVGIGTTTPSNKLTVQGNAHITGALYDNNNSAGSNGMVLQSTGSGFNWVATSSLGISGGGGGGLAATDIDTCSELATIISGETGTCGSLVLSASPTFTGTVNAAAATLSSTLTMSGSAANIALGSNFLSGDGGDEGISINTNGDFTFTGASGDSLFINLNEGSGYPTFFSSANTISLSANTEILDGFELSLSDEGNDRSAYLLVENNGATVFGNSAGDIALMPTGNVGIGTSTPGARLEIAGSASVSATVPAIRLSDTAGNPNSRNWEISNARGPYGSLAFLQSSTVGGVPTSANTRLLIDHNGNVGIGTTTPGEKLHVDGPTFIGPTVSSSPAGTLSTYGVYLSNAGYISMNRNNGTALYAGRSNDGTLVSFHSAGISQGSISVSGATLSYNAFTGSHYAHLDGVEVPESGTVMSMTSNNVYQGNDPTISAEPIYGVVPSSIENDDRILGTYLSLTDPTKPYSNSIGEDYNPYLVSAVGNGFMWVVDSGEDIEVGDWLITASTTGHAKKDPKTHSVSHVIAKASESVVWDNVTSTTVDGVKHVKIQVLFENFDRPNSIVLDGPIDNATSSHALLSFNDTTIWSRLAKLAASFVDGVLTLTKASIEYVRTDFLEARDGRFSEQLCVGDVCVDEDTFLALVGGASATSSDLTTSEGILCLGNTCIDEDGLRELMRENNVNVIDPNTLENQEDEEQQTGTSTNPVDNTTANGTTGTSSSPVINDSGIASSTATSTNDGTGTTATSTNSGTGGVTLDTTAPTVTLNGSGSLIITVGDSYTEEGATATDDTDGDITAGIVISGTVDTSTAGTYMITYEVEDQAGNMAETTRTITVEEAPASNPEIPPTEPVVVDPIPTP